MDLSDKTVVVAGLGVSGTRRRRRCCGPAAARVIGVDEDQLGGRPALVRRRGLGSVRTYVMSSPVFNPRTPFVLEAQRRGIPVYERGWSSRGGCAWTARAPARPAPWVGIAGPNGRTSTTEMTSAMLRRLRPRRAGGRQHRLRRHEHEPVPFAAVDPEQRRAVRGAELVPAALHRFAGAGLRGDHEHRRRPPRLAWRASRAYAADKSRRCSATSGAPWCYNAQDDRRVSALAARRRRPPRDAGKRRIHARALLQAGEIGVDDGWIVDRSGVAGGAVGDRGAPGRQFTGVPRTCAEPDGSRVPAPGGRRD